MLVQIEIALSISCLYNAKLHEVLFWLDYYQGITDPRQILRKNQTCKKGKTVLLKCRYK